MNEKENYFISYCNSKGTALSFYVDRFLNVKDIKEKDNLIKTIIEYLEDVKNTGDKLGIYNHMINNFDNNVILLKKLNNQTINDYLRKVNYDYSFNFEYLNIMHLIKKNKTLSKKDLDFVEYMLKHSFIKNEDMDLINNYFIKLVMVRENPETIVSMNGMKYIFKNYVSSLINNHSKKVFCHFNDKNENDYLDKSINLKNEDLYNFYYSGDTSIFITMYKQIYNVISNKKLKYNLDDTTINELKDYILTKVLNWYKDENYDVLSYNINSQKYAIEQYLKLLESYNLQFSDGKNPYEEEFNKLNKANTEERYYDGINVNVNHLFTKIIENYFDLINAYPELTDKLNLLIDNKYVERGRFTI